MAPRKVLGLSRVGKRHSFAIETPSSFWAPGTSSTMQNTNSYFMEGAGIQLFNQTLTLGISGKLFVINIYSQLPSGNVRREDSSVLSLMSPLSLFKRNSALLPGTEVIVRGLVSFPFLFFLYLFICLCRGFVATCGLFSWGMWDLVPRPGIEPGPPALGMQSLSHWTTREVPPSPFLRYGLSPYLVTNITPCSLANDCCTFGFLISIIPERSFLYTAYIYSKKNH